MTDVDVMLISEVLGVPVRKLYMLSSDRVPRQKRGGSYSNYHQSVIYTGRTKKKRVLTVPNGFLKLVQRRILDRCLSKLSVSEYATAYRNGTSVRDNALLHTGKEFIIKLDISVFFDSINDDAVYMVMKQFRLRPRATSLLTHLCVHRGVLPQGAPTSPYIANLVMKHFDEHIGAWCAERNITYSRYCDDMTFSGSRDDLLGSRLVGKVGRKLYAMGFTLNREKTVFAGSSQRQTVTGLVVNEKADLPREKRRELRQEVYYCLKYGVREHLSQRGSSDAPLRYINGLMGRLAYQLQQRPEDETLRESFEKLKELREKEAQNEEKSD